MKEEKVVRTTQKHLTGEELRAAGIADLFEARIDGVVIGQKQLWGKLAPDTFLAARALGVDRVGQAEALQRHGADIVVCDLAELVERQ